MSVVDARAIHEHCVEIAEPGMALCPLDRPERLTPVDGIQRFRPIEIFERFLNAIQLGEKLAPRVEIHRIRLEPDRRVDILKRFVETTDPLPRPVAARGSDLTVGEKNDRQMEI
jgi:hypothetical protein